MRDTTKLIDIEKKQWDELYQYVKSEILQYDSNQSIPRNIILRLKGMKNGKLMANNNTQNNAEYSYEIILYTFKVCKQNILNAVITKDFKSEMNKFIYIAAIVENNLNDVYIRVTNAKKSKEKTENVIVDNMYNDGADYQKKTEETSVSKKLNDLW